MSHKETAESEKKASTKEWSKGDNNRPSTQSRHIVRKLADCRSHTHTDERSQYLPQLHRSRRACVLRLLYKRCDEHVQLSRSKHRQYMGCFKTRANEIGQEKFQRIEPFCSICDQMSYTVLHICWTSSGDGRAAGEAGVKRDKIERLYDRL